ncbi:hypothetical protein N9Y42_01750 [Mariniblastus sp.]|nr:hypothetical protein [Mariniblastus sp.]
MTPAQIGVHLICGKAPSPRAPATLRKQLQEGREMLRSITGQDFGFDLQAWHDYLKETRDGGYTWNRTVVLPKIMQAALKNKRWLDTAALLVRATDE